MGPEYSNFHQREAGYSFVPHDVVKFRKVAKEHLTREERWFSSIKSNDHKQKAFICVKAIKSDN
jgi:hypothetical protein